MSTGTRLKPQAQQWLIDSLNEYAEQAQEDARGAFYFGQLARELEPAANVIRPLLTGTARDLWDYRIAYNEAAREAR